jgi:hypothetical protein
MVTPLRSSLRHKRWFILVLSILPVVLYITVFQSVALNVNYVAFDDILILGIIPGFSEASWAERWLRLSELFPEHRLVFSRSVILLLYNMFGKVNLVWLMIIGNLCWGLCAVVFYRVFVRTKLSLWYFLPIPWLWFNIQSFENIFWGVSSLCNFGVLFFILSAIYFSVYHKDQIILSLLFAVAASFTYGNGIFVFPVIGLINLLTGRPKSFLITAGVATVTAVIYFFNFSPITQSLNFSDPNQLKEGFLGFFGFLGSLATLSAADTPVFMLYAAVVAGMLVVAAFLFLVQKQFVQLWNSLWQRSEYQGKTFLFALAVAIFVGITALMVTYKRIPSDAFEGMFKGRYRMYSPLLCIAVYLAFLSVEGVKARRIALTFILPFTILLNLVILHDNFVKAVNFRRAAIVQEFNARYNSDWLGLRMFSMDNQHFEKIRACYGSADPLAEAWTPASGTDPIPYIGIHPADTVKLMSDHIFVGFSNDFAGIEKDFSDGTYVILKSVDHVYAAAPTLYANSLKGTVRRLRYFLKEVNASIHKANVEPGHYKIYLLARKNGRNKIYWTGSTWDEK